MENLSFKINGIKLLIEKNYKVSLNLIDLNSMIDNNLSMSENWDNIKPKVLLLCDKPNKFMF